MRLFERWRHRSTLVLVAMMLVTLLPLAVVSAEAPAVASVSVGGELAHPMTLDARQLAAMPHVTVQGSIHGVPGRWSGVPLSTILAAAGAPHGKTLRGKAMSLYVRIRAADGYQVVYALAELDPGFRREPVILADHLDGKPLDAKQGPFRVVAPDELRPARWIRQVTAIDVLRAPNH